MITIAWDVDDVLNELMRVWFEEGWLPKHPACRLAYEDIRKNPPSELLGVGDEAYLASLDEFRLSGRYRKMPPVSEVKDWFTRHGNKYRHIALTAVSLKAAHVSAEWVLSHFGAWIRTFHFIPSPRRGEKAISYDKSKNDFLKWLGTADVFIDDNESNIKGCERMGVRGIVFPRPWNKSVDTVSDVLHTLSEL